MKTITCLLLLVAAPASAQSGPIAHALEAGFVGLQVADLVTTRRAVQSGTGHEANPLMAQPSVAVALKAGASVVLVAAMEHWRQRHPKAAWVTLAVLDAGYAAIVARNARIGGRR